MTKSSMQPHIYIPVSLGVLTSVVWFLTTADLGVALINGLSVLVVLGFHRTSTPAPPVNELAQVDTLVIDQAAPVAVGIPEIKAIRSIDSKVSDLALLQRVASLEKNSEHPFALSILQMAKAKKFELLEVSNFKAFDGMGVSGFVNDRKMVVGSAALLRQEGVNPGPLEALAGNLIREGFTVALIAAEGRPIGLISAQSPLPPDDNLKLADLQMRGFSVVQVPPDLPPEQKADLVKKLQIEGAKVAVATDGLENLVKSLEAARAEVPAPVKTPTLSILYNALFIPVVALVLTLGFKLFLDLLPATSAGCFLAVLLFIGFNRRPSTMKTQ